MSLQQISFSTPDGGGVTLTLSAPVTPDLVEALGEASAQMLRALERDEPAQQARKASKAGEAGEAEYASWFANRSGDAEYGSWAAHLRHC